MAVDTDSAYGDTAESTKSLSSSVLAYTYENGRRYHAFREGEYVLPNDEREQDRLDLLHHIFKLILRGSVVAAPIHKHVQRVLDIGTGTGIWAIDFADEHPAAEVIGIDLSPIQPTWIPPNCMFVVDDAEEDWLYTPGRAFDYIHGRAMGGSISNWPKLYAQIYKHLKPGCWVEMQEYETEIVSDDGTLDNAVYVKEWQETVNAASVSFGKEFNVAGRHKQRMIDAGFLDVTDEIHKVLPLPSTKPQFIHQLTKGI